MSEVPDVKTADGYLEPSVLAAFEAWLKRLGR
jgi:hypothetical protein